jgi:linoleoyl-CoA desaturase
MSAAFHELRSEIRALGLDRRRAAPIVRIVALHLAVFAVSVAAYIAIDALWYRACCLIVMTATAMGIGTHTHTSAHHATSERRWLNQTLTYLGYPLFGGFSAGWWAHKHHVVHHAAPNVVGVDKDIDLAPYFAMTEAEVAASRGLRRLYYRLQWLVFPFALALNYINFVAQSWIFVVGRLIRGEGRRPALLLDLALMTLHLIVSIGVPALWLGLGGALWLHLLRYVGLGLGMFLVFAPGHFPAEAVCLGRRAAPHEFASLQIHASNNFRAGLIGRLICGGLEHQIEHHLFPNVSPVHYPRLRTLVRQFCARNGLPYHEASWDRAVWRSLAVLRRPKQITADLAAPVA